MLGELVDAAADFLDCAARFHRQLAHFVGDDREAAPRFAGAGGLDGGVEGQQVGLGGDAMHQRDEVAEGARFVGDALDAQAVVVRFLAALVDVAIHAFEQLPVADEDGVGIEQLLFGFGVAAGDQAVEFVHHRIDLVQASDDVERRGFGQFNGVLQLCAHHAGQCVEAQQFLADRLLPASGVGASRQFLTQCCLLAERGVAVEEE